jgi:predicted nucleic acid-binding protein
MLNLFSMNGKPARVGILAGLSIIYGANDLWIACHALAENAVLVTHNLRDFQRIKGLRLENWVDGS